MDVLLITINKKELIRSGMRKLLFFLMAYFLVGCGDKKVTKEYLVGEWYCYFSEYENSQIDNEDEWKLTDEFGDVETYQLIDGKLYLEDDNDKLTFFDIDAKLNNEHIEMPLNYGKNGFVKISQIYQKIDKNKYVLTMQSESNIKTSANKQNYFRKKIISSCERLK